MDAIHRIDSEHDDLKANSVPLPTLEVLGSSAASRGRSGSPSYTNQDMKAMAIHGLGIILYRFGLETFTGSITVLATNRYDHESVGNFSPSRTFERLGLLHGTNQAAYLLGYSMIPHAAQNFRLRNVLFLVVVLFSLATAALLILDAKTGGKFTGEVYNRSHLDGEWWYYGNYNNDWMMAVYVAAGLAQGMVEGLLRIRLADMVHGSAKLREADTIFHMCGAFAGAAAAMLTGLLLIPAWGANSSFVVAPICSAAAAVAWYFVPERSDNLARPSAKSVVTAARLVFTSAAFCWLVPAYSVALYAHRYLEHAVAPQVARRYLGDAAWAPVFVGFSNLGELLGVLGSILFRRLIPTSIPWLRIGAIVLLAVWVVPYGYPSKEQSWQAGVASGSFVLISFFWAAGHSLLPGSILALLEGLPPASITSLLFSFFFVMYAVASPLLGRYIDGIYNSTGSIREALFYTVGIQYSVIPAIIFLSTLIPKGSRSLNPRLP